MVNSAKEFLRGPAWKVAGGLGFVSLLIGAIGGDFFVWLSLGLGLLVVASFTTFHQSRVEAQRKAESLPRRIDELHREGIELLAELSERIEPETTGENAWSLPLGAPPERWAKAEEFEQRARDLLIGGYPALLTDYADGFNEFRRKRREEEAARASGPEKDTHSNAVKLREFADHMHSRPAYFVEASLEGLRSRGIASGASRSSAASRELRERAPRGSRSAGLVSVLV